VAILQKITTFNGDQTNSKVYLGFAGDFDVNEITSIIGLKPTHFHNKGDKIKSIVKKDGSPAYHKFSVWDYGTEYEYTRDIDEQCERIVNQLINKQAEIISIVEKYNCTVTFEIVSVIEKGKTPSLGISQNVMNFCTAIKADIDIDIYANPYDESENTIEVDLSDSDIIATGLKIDNSASE
jgi:hypothetical protein